jgi:hypothetical protein
MTEKASPEAGFIEEQTRFVDETKEGALKVLFPEPDEVRSRIPLITRLTGRAADIRKLIRANAEYEFRRAIAEKRAPDWSKIDPIQRLLDLSVSLGSGKGRAEAVEIAKTESAPEPSRGLLGLFGGRRRRE